MSDFKTRAIIGKTVVPYTPPSGIVVGGGRREAVYIGDTDGRGACASHWVEDRGYIGSAPGDDLGGGFLAKRFGRR